VSYTNQDIWNLVDDITRKELRGNIIGGNQRNRLLKMANTQHFNNLLNEYEVNQEITDSLQVFKTTKTGAELTPASNDSYGYYLTLPTDYARFGELGYKYSGNPSNYKVVELLTDDEWHIRRGSIIKRPTRKYPIATIRGDKIYYAPDANDDEDALQTSYLELIYLKRPTEPVYATTYNSTTDDYTYDSGSSTELEWNDEDKMKIVGIILTYAGVKLSEGDIYQYAQQYRAEQ
jgi:hypothetical protein